MKYRRTKLVLAGVGLFLLTLLWAAVVVDLVRKTREPLLHFIHDAAVAAQPPTEKQRTP